jgi:hypothetical protein
MQILLTPDQESTLWHLTEKILTPKGDAFYCFPYALKVCGGGMFERIPLNMLPEDVRTILDSKLIYSSKEVPTLSEWLNAQIEFEMKNDYLCTFIYNDKQCAGLITKSVFGDSLAIRPINSTDDIGEGAGIAIYKEFKRTA